MRGVWPCPGIHFLRRALVATAALTLLCAVSAAAPCNTRQIDLPASFATATTFSLSAPSFVPVRRVPATDGVARLVVSGSDAGLVNSLALDTNGTVVDGGVGEIIVISTAPPPPSPPPPPPPFPPPPSPETPAPAPAPPPPGPPPAAAASPPSSGGSAGPIIGAVVAVVLIGAIVAGALLWYKRSRSSTGGGKTAGGAHDTLVEDDYGVELTADALTAGSLDMVLSSDVTAGGSSTASSMSTAASGSRDAPAPPSLASSAGSTSGGGGGGGGAGGPAPFSVMSFAILCLALVCIPMVADSVSSLCFVPVEVVFYDPTMLDGCGDGVCALDGSETGICREDCGACYINGVCEVQAGESSANCPADCVLATLASSSPFDGETYVAGGRTLRFKYHTPLNMTAGGALVVTAVSADGSPVPGSLFVSPNGTEVQFVPDSALPPATLVTVNIDGSAVSAVSSSLSFSTLNDGLSVAGTGLYGYVRASYAPNDPLEGVVITVSGMPTLSATTDAAGYFELMGVSAPMVFCFIDGSGVSDAMGRPYAHLGKPFHTVPGQLVQLTMDGEPFDVYLPVVDDASDAQPLSAGSAPDIGFGPTALAAALTFTNASAATLNAVSLSIDGARVRGNPSATVTEALIVPVPFDRLPAPLDAGSQAPLVISVQARTSLGLGSTVDFETPAQLSFPNINNAPPGERMLLRSFDHDAGVWTTVGVGEVSPDGTLIHTVEGGVLSPGWHIFDPLGEFEPTLSEENYGLDWYDEDGDGIGDPPPGYSNGGPSGPPPPPNNDPRSPADRAFADAIKYSNDARSGAESLGNDLVEDIAKGGLKNPKSRVSTLRGHLDRVSNVVQDSARALDAVGRYASAKAQGGDARPADLAAMYPGLAMDSTSAESVLADAATWAVSVVNTMAGSVHAYAANTVELAWAVYEPVSPAPTGPVTTLPTNNPSPLSTESPALDSVSALPASAAGLALASGARVSAQGYLQTSGDADTYALGTVPAGSCITAEVSHPLELAPSSWATLFSVSLIDASGALLATDSDSGPRITPLIDEHCLTGPTDLYVRVSPARYQPTRSGEAWAPGTEAPAYTLAVERQDGGRRGVRRFGYAERQARASELLVAGYAGADAAAPHQGTPLPSDLAPMTAGGSPALLGSTRAQEANYESGVRNVTRGVASLSSATVPLNPQVEQLYVSYQYADNGAFVRPPQGTVSATLRPGTAYTMRVFSLTTGRCALEVYPGLTAGNTRSANVLISRLGLSTCSPLDTDGDGLLDDSERAVGTSPVLADTDGDGIDDLTELRSGLNPLSGLGFPIGIIAQSPLATASSRTAMRVRGQGTLVAVCSNLALSMFDVSGVSSIRLSGSYRTPDFAGCKDIVINANTLFVALRGSSPGVVRMSVAATGSLSVDAGLRALDGLDVVALADAGDFVFAATDSIIYCLTKLGLSVMDTVAVPEAGIVDLVSRANDRLYVLMDGGDMIRAFDSTLPYALVASPVPDLAVPGSSSATRLIAAGAQRLIADVPSIDGSVEVLLTPGSGAMSVGLTGLAASNFVSWGGYSSNGNGLDIAFGKGPANRGSDNEFITLSGGLVNTRVVAPSDGADVVGDSVVVQSLAYAASSNSIYAVSYQDADVGGVAPTVSARVPSSVPFVDGTYRVTLGKRIPILVEATDDVAISHVSITTAEGELVAIRTTAPFDFFLAVPGGLDTESMLTITATDSGGNTGTTQLAYRLVPDPDPPILLFTSIGDASAGFGAAFELSSFELVFDKDVAVVDIGAVSLSRVDAPAGPVAFAARAYDNRMLISLSSDGVFPRGRYSLSIGAGAIASLTNVTTSAPQVLEFLAFRRADLPDPSVTNLVIWVGDPATTDGQWTTASNWLGSVVPAPSQVAFIDVPGSAEGDLTVTFQASPLVGLGGIWARHHVDIYYADRIEVTGSAGVVMLGDADLTLHGALYLDGPDVSFDQTATGTGALRLAQTGDLVVMSGASATLSRIEYFKYSSFSGHSLLEARDVGSTITLASPFVGPESPLTDHVELYARYGGTIGPVPSSVTGLVEFTQGSAASTIVGVQDITSCTDCIFDVYVNLPVLVSAPGTQITLRDVTGELIISDLTGGALAHHGTTAVNYTVLTVLDDVDVRTYDDSRAQFNVVNSAVGPSTGSCHAMNIDANGDSAIELPVLTSVTGGTLCSSGVDIDASSTARISFDSLVSVASGYVSFTRSSSGRIYLPALTSFASDAYNKASEVAADEAPLLATLGQGATATYDYFEGTSPITTVAADAKTALRCYGGNVTFPGITGTMQDVSVWAWYGGKCTFPNVVGISGPATGTCRATSVDVDDAGSVLDFPAVTSVTGGTLCSSGVDIDATQSGQVTFGSLVSVASGYVSFTRSSSGRIYLPALTSFASDDPGKLSVLDADEAPVLVTVGQGARVVYDYFVGTSPITTVASDGNAELQCRYTSDVAFSGLSGTLTDVSVTADDGRCAFPSVTSIVGATSGTCRSTGVYAYGGDVDFSSVTSATGVTLCSSSLVVSATSSGIVRFPNLPGISTGSVSFSTSSGDIDVPGSFCLPTARTFDTPSGSFTSAVC